MRLEQLTLHLPGDDVIMRFHERLTIVAGIGEAERQEMTDLLIGALAGRSPHPYTLLYIDSCGRQVQLSNRSGEPSSTYVIDGAPAPDLINTLGLDRESIDALIKVTAPDVGILPTDISVPATGELAEVRRTLSRIEADLRDAMEVRARLESMRSRLSQIDEEIRASREGEAKRRFARILVDLERVRSEAAVIRGGSDSIETDKRLVQSAEDVRALATEWREALTKAAELRSQLGDVAQMDEREVASALAGPADLPPNLEELASELNGAERRRDLVADRLASETGGRLPEPSHPAVLRLAQANQEAVWNLNQRVIDAGLRVQQASLNLGGLEADGMAPDLIEELEAAHREVENTENALSERKGKAIAATAGGIVAAAGALAALPVVAPIGLAGAAGAAAWGVLSPKRRLAKALGREEDALTKAGAPTYLSFHMRRIDATLDSRLREELEREVAEQRQAQAEWTVLAGDLSALDAIELEDEIRELAHQLRLLEGDEANLAALREELEHQLEPAVARARQTLLDALRPFGLTDPHTAVATAKAMVARAAAAKAQTELAEVQIAEEQLREKMEARLSELGFDEGDVQSRLGGYEWALGAAVERTKARANARPPAVVAAELARLEDLARTEQRAEWGGSVTHADAEGPDEHSLQQERAALAATYNAASRDVPAIDELNDRRKALQRRVTVLEAESEGGEAPSFHPSDLEPRLLARLAAARRPAADDETLFLVLDEPFLRVRGSGKWEAMDMIERLGQQVQMIYLSEDPDVVSWARRRTGSGSITLMEPMAEPA